MLFFFANLLDDDDFVIANFVDDDVVIANFVDNDAVFLQTFWMMML